MKGPGWAWVGLGERGLGERGWVRGAGWAWVRGAG